MFARNGKNNFICEGIPTNYVPKSAVNVEFKERVKKKILSVMRKGYVVVKENMKSLIHFFRVAKT